MTFVEYSYEEGDKWYAMDGANEKLKKYYDAGCCSYIRCIYYLGFLWQLWHHYTDLYYTFAAPHWNWGVVLLLLVSFWVPLSILIFFVFSWPKTNITGYKREGWFEHIFIDPEGV